MKLKIELRCILFPLIILEMFLQLNWSPPVVNSVDWAWFGKAHTCLYKVPIGSGVHFGHSWWWMFLQKDYMYHSAWSRFTFFHILLCYSLIVNKFFSSKFYSETTWDCFWKKSQHKYSSLCHEAQNWGCILFPLIILEICCFEWPSQSPDLNLSILERCCKEKCANGQRSLSGAAKLAKACGIIFKMNWGCNFCQRCINKVLCKGCEYLCTCDFLVFYF